MIMRSIVFLLSVTFIFAKNVEPRPKTFERGMI